MRISKITSITKKHSGIATARNAARELIGFADEIIVSEGTPNKRFEPTSASGWIEVGTWKQARDYLTGKEYEKIVFVKTCAVAGKRRIYVPLNDNFRRFEGKDITEKIDEVMI